MALILVGEDDLDVTELLLILLEDAGHETVHVDNGEAAVEAYARSRPDLVLLDVAMPGALDGLEVTRRLRVLEGAGDRGRVPVMLLTARALEEDRRSGLAAGADAYLVKPFEIDEMLQTIDSLLA
ncbi:response regulator [Nocardioides sp.]|uniref:response regulator transcription factor n=1 Tax=Nocardioides sp. TaxID=35761 RepID=UPI00286D073A|nr:response regulator [Nocardioides sp.]